MSGIKQSHLPLEQVKYFRESHRSSLLQDSPYNDLVIPCERIGVIRNCKMQKKYVLKNFILNAGIHDLRKNATDTKTVGNKLSLCIKRELAKKSKMERKLVFEIRYFVRPRSTKASVLYAPDRLLASLSGRIISIREVMRLQKKHF